MRIRLNGSRNLSGFWTSKEGSLCWRLTSVIRDEEDARLPGLARQVLQVLAIQIEQIDAAVVALEKQLMAWHKTNPVSQRTIPGIGPIIATAIAAMVARVIER